MLTLIAAVVAAMAGEYNPEIRHPASVLYPLAVEYQLPQPGVALALSSTYGFGAGHFYAGDPQAGALHATGQAIALAAAGMGAGLLVSKHEEQRLLGAGLVGVGAPMLVVLRFADGATAPRTAKREALRMIRHAPEPGY